MVDLKTVDEIKNDDGVLGRQLIEVLLEQRRSRSVLGRTPRSKLNMITDGRTDRVRCDNSNGSEQKGPMTSTRREDIRG